MNNVLFFQNWILILLNFFFSTKNVDIELLLNIHSFIQ